MNHDKARPLTDHLEDFRRLVFCCVLLWLVCFLVMVPLVPRVVGLLIRPLTQQLPTLAAGLQSLEVTGAFRAAVLVAGWGGLLLSLPGLLVLMTRYLRPALRPKEQRMLGRAVGVGCVLFLAGISAGYFGVLPVGLRMMNGLHQWMGIVPRWTFSCYLAFAVHLVAGFGIAFELPVLVYGAGVLGWLKVEQLRHARRYVVVGVLLLAMLMTPPDIFTQLMMALPLMVLYELCVWVLARQERF
jgi:sec-independent protein translocase protein TatC